MNKRNIGKEIIAGLEELKAWRRGEVKLKTHVVEMPTAADVPAIRKELGLSQPEFAGFMGVSLGTLRNWEQGRRMPDGPALALLPVAAHHPAAVPPQGTNSTTVPAPLFCSASSMAGHLQDAI